MGTPLPCDNHPDQMAVVLITNLENGETLTLCGPCMFQWAAVLAAVENQGLEPTETAQKPAEEVADLESARPTPDAQAKSEPGAEEPEEPWTQLAATPAQETQAASE